MRTKRLIGVLRTVSIFGASLWIACSASAQARPAPITQEAEPAPGQPFGGLPPDPPASMTSPEQRELYRHVLFSIVGERFSGFSKEQKQRMLDRLESRAREQGRPTENAELLREAILNPRPLIEEGDSPEIRELKEEMRAWILETYQPPGQRRPPAPPRRPPRGDTPPDSRGST